MDRNSIIGLSLIFVLLIGYFFINQPSEQELAIQKRVADSIALVKENEKIQLSLYGYDINVPVPKSAFRITGFEITPRSIPTGKTCTP